MIPPPPTRLEIAEHEARRREIARARQERAAQESRIVADARARRRRMRESEIRRIGTLQRLAREYAAECRAQEAHERTLRAYLHRVLADRDHRARGWRERQDAQINCPDRDPASGLFREESA